MGEVFDKIQLLMTPLRARLINIYSGVIFYIASEYGGSVEKFISMHGYFLRDRSGINLLNSSR